MSLKNAPSSVRAYMPTQCRWRSQQWLTALWAKIDWSTEYQGLHFNCLWQVLSFPSERFVNLTVIFKGRVFERTWMRLRNDEPSISKDSVGILTNQTCIFDLLGCVHAKGLCGSKIVTHKQIMGLHDGPGQDWDRGSKCQTPIYLATAMWPWRVQAMHIFFQIAAQGGVASLAWRRYALSNPKFCQQWSCNAFDWRSPSSEAQQVCNVVEHLFIAQSDIGPSFELHLTFPELWEKPPWKIEGKYIPTLFSRSYPEGHKSLSVLRFWYALQDLIPWDKVFLSPLPCPVLPWNGNHGFIGIQRAGCSNTCDPKNARPAACLP